MSFKIVAEVFEVKVGNPLRKMVLLKLADQANDKGECFPSYGTIAKACEVSKRSVITHIQWLEKHGFLWIEKRYNKEAQRNLTNVYHLTVTKGSLDEEKEGCKPYTSENDSPTPSAGDSLGSAGDSPTPSAGDSPKPITLEPITKPIKNKTKKISDEQSLIDFWNIRAGGQVKLQTWQAKIKQRLKTFTVSEIQQAMLGVIESNWHKSEGQVLIKHAINSDEKCETAIARYHQPKNTGQNNANSTTGNRRNYRETQQQFEQRLQAEFNQEFGVESGEEIHAR